MMYWHPNPHCPASLGLFDVDHQGDSAVSGRLIIRSNRQQANFDLFETPVNAPDESNGRHAGR